MTAIIFPPRAKPVRRVFVISDQDDLVRLINVKNVVFDNFRIDPGSLLYNDLINRMMRFEPDIILIDLSLEGVVCDDIVALTARRFPGPFLGVVSRLAKVLDPNFADFTFGELNNDLMLRLGSIDDMRRL